MKPNPSEEPLQTPQDIPFPNDLLPDSADASQSEEDDEEEVEDTGMEYERFRFVVDRGQETMRIDIFLMERIEKITRNRVQNAIHDGFVKVNGEKTKPNYKIKPGDTIIITWYKPKQTYELLGEDIPLDVRYEDDDVLVLYKPAGMVAHPAVGNYTGTLANALKYRFEQANMPLLNKDHPDRPGLVHRIDKNTTGLLVITKSERAMESLSKQFFKHTVYRRYIALVWGDLKQDEGTINEPLGRNPSFRKLRTVVDKDDPTGKHSVTHYKVLKRFGYVTLVECRLETGRTHQIRVHMKHIGHPLFNDFEYGGDKIIYGTVYGKYKQFIENCFQLMPHHTLHAYAIGFDHPNGTYFQLEADMPDNFKELLERWERYTEGRLG